MSENRFRAVNRAVPKTDAFSIMGGAPVYTGDMVPRDALTVLLLRSPHAFARVKKVHKDKAMLVSGVVCVLDHTDVPSHRYSNAGASYPGNNPFDRRILDEYARYVGDPVALVAAETEEAARKALKLIRVEYEVLQPVLDYETADTDPSVVHPEDNFVFQCDIGGDLEHNVLSTIQSDGGDFDAAYAACPIQLDETYHTMANQQAMMETFRTYSYLDQAGRLTLVSSTQITFHARRLVSQALGIPQAKVRVIKPRVGGGFGAKQSMGTELFAAVVTHLTGRPAYCCFTRQETCQCTNTRHAFRIRVRMGADLDGTVRALWVDSLENAGAYGEHAANVIGLSAHKTIPLCAKAEDWRFTGKVVYTNTTPGGAYRGFGATQGCFAVESTLNKLAVKLHLDPTLIRLKNIPEVGKPMSAYYGEVLQSCSLDRCIATGKKMISWDEKYAPAPFSKPSGPHRYRGVGMAVSMQGSGITATDNCSVTLRLDDGGFYTLLIGASDIGTGCDTILAQMAAEILQCDTEKITVSGVDTSYSPYDKGSYASSTTYITGNATTKAAKELLGKMYDAAAETLKVPREELFFDGESFSGRGARLTVFELGRDSVNRFQTWLSATASFSSPTSPPPFVAGFAEVEVDTQTGEVKLLDLVGVVDCGTVINKALAHVQAEGGFAQGAGMALYEQVHLTEEGKLSTNSFMQYKLPSRLDLPPIRIAFEESYEPTGPFGAKSIGEVVINTPSPAIMAAIQNAVGVTIQTLPATAEKVFMALRAAEGQKEIR
ncbi:MAG: molybdopterin-dependent oxidoreductase [Clostridia bacterium]|nr:molybdopterin-dependent oxidoreductase [Clostridia bacterium]